MLADIHPRLAGVKYLTLKVASSRYNSLKLNEKSSYLVTFSHPFGRFGFIRLPFGAAPVVDMLQKIDKFFSDIPNVIGISDYTLIAGFDAGGMDHDKGLEQVLCRQANLQLNKEKCFFRQICTQCFDEVISRHGVNSYPAEYKALMDMPPSKTKREL